MRLIGYPLEGMVRLRAGETAVTVDHGVADPAKGGVTGLRGDVRRGHSGGPLVDGRGAVAGMLRQKVNTVEAFRRDGRILRLMGAYAPAPALRAFLSESGVEPAPTSIAPPAAYTMRIDCLRRDPSVLGD